MQLNNGLPLRTQILLFCRWLIKTFTTCVHKRFQYISSYWRFNRHALHITCSNCHSPSNSCLRQLVTWHNSRVLWHYGVVWL